MSYGPIRTIIFCYFFLRRDQLNKNWSLIIRLTYYMVYMVQMYYGCLQLSECQNNIASLEHSLTISQQELAVVTEAKKQEVTLLQERVSLG